MPNHNIEDLRWKYSIGITGTGIKDLNDYLQNREEIQSKKRNLVENKCIKSEVVMLRISALKKKLTVL